MSKVDDLGKANQGLQGTITQLKAEKMEKTVKIKNPEKEKQNLRSEMDAEIAKHARGSSTLDQLATDAILEGPSGRRSQGIRGLKIRYEVWKVTVQMEAKWPASELLQSCRGSSNGNLIHDFRCRIRFYQPKVSQMIF